MKLLVHVMYDTNYLPFCGSLFYEFVFIVGSIDSRIIIVVDIMI